MKSARDAELVLNQDLEAYWQVASDKATDASEDIESGSSSTAILSRARALEQKVETSLRLFESAIDDAERRASPLTAVVRAQLASLRSRLSEHASDFKKSRDAFQAKRDRSALLSGRSSAATEVGASDPARLLSRERAKIDLSSRGMDEAIGSAQAVQFALRAQRERLSATDVALDSLAKRFPGINALVRATDRKKLRDNLIVASVIALLTLFSFWWVLG